MKILQALDRNRHYTYSAYLSGRGRLLRITAGCRVWNSFRAAFDHYSHKNKTLHRSIPKDNMHWRWSDDWINRQASFWMEPASRDVAQKHRKDRAAAIKTLKRLKAKVDKYRDSIVAKKKPTKGKPARKRK